MENLDSYINEINNVFACLDLLEKNWLDKDNINFINNLNSYKEDVLGFKDNVISSITSSSDKEEENLL